MPKHEILPNGQLKISIEPAEADASQTIEELLKPLIDETNLVWIDPSDTGDLITAPMLGILGPVTSIHEGCGFQQAGFWDSKHWSKPILQRWVFPSESQKHLLAEIQKKKEITLQGGTLLREETLPLWIQKLKGKAPKHVWILPADKAGNTIGSEEQKELLINLGSLIRFSITRSDDRLPTTIKIVTPEEYAAGIPCKLLEFTDTLGIDQGLQRTTLLKNRITDYLRGYILDRTYKTTKNQ
jgi:hypothetical protein